ncbi:MAG: hypothetical protein AAGD04_15430, partial [Pseudomonadota bacterium]
PKHHQIQTEAIDPLAHQLNHFLDVIERRTPPIISAEDATKSLKLALEVEKILAHTLYTPSELTPAKELGHEV